jgi:hypothetical protein
LAETQTSSSLGQIQYRLVVSFHRLSVPGPGKLKLSRRYPCSEYRMNVHKNARLTAHSRERIGRQIESGQRPVAAAEARGCLPAHGMGNPLYRRDGTALGASGLTISVRCNLPNRSAATCVNVRRTDIKKFGPLSRGLITALEAYEELCIQRPRQARQEQCSGCRGNLRTSNSKARTVW